MAQDRSAGRHQLILLVVLLAFATLFPMVSAQAAETATSWTCGTSGCKYNQTQVTYDGNTVKKHRIWGSTASGTCDPTNDGIQWRVSSTKIYSNGYVVYSSSGSYQTNCTIDNSPPPPTWWTWYPETGTNPCCRFSRHWVFHDHLCAGCDWTAVLTNSY